ncbi:hypothetical protein M2447_001299 [Ereboglobus sp. PH5-10]|uniref:hypothetical protein n=1 Tax=Ereboglobus sp. PH5-10 TaxID=2940629 RepID=UPI002405EA13|nr:hypothetical protein [Ereboglobus sp. PH5-10]MDF9827210.1 hypothetical protein [Ereboglobus sp. PH5-10]
MTNNRGNEAATGVVAKCALFFRPEIEHSSNFSPICPSKIFIFKRNERLRAFSIVF